MWSQPACSGGSGFTLRGYLLFVMEAWMKYRKLNKIERKVQEFRNWCYETTDAKIVTAAFVLVASVIIFWEML